MREKALVCGTIIAYALAGALIIELFDFRQLADRQLDRYLVARHWAELQAVAAYRDSAHDSEHPANIVVFIDYSCEVCRRAEAVLSKVAQGEPRAVVRYVNTPTNSPFSLLAARAAICSAAQGAFPPMHESLYNWSTPSEVPTVEYLVHAAQIPRAEDFLRCMASDSARRVLASEAVVAARFRVQGTPTFVGKGGILRGLPDEAEELIRHVMGHSREP